MSFLTNGVSSSRSFQNLGLMLSSSTAYTTHPHKIRVTLNKLLQPGLFKRQAADGTRSLTGLQKALSSQ